MKYKVIKPNDRRFYVVRYSDPFTGEPRQQSTGHTRKREADRFAAELAAQIEAGHSSGRDMSWAAFVDLCKTDKLAKIKSSAGYVSALASFAAGTGIKSTREINRSTVDAYLRWAASSGLAKSSQASYAKHLSAVFHWAENRGIIARAPKIQAGSTEVMRGRPLTLEEFERMIASAPKVVGAKNAPAIQNAMIAAWSIGLRRAELLRLSWDDHSRIRIIDLAARRPMIHFPADQHKAGRDCTLPLTGEAIELLRRISRRGMSGAVLGPFRGKRKAIATADGLGRVISDIGERAAVVTGSRDGAPVYATAHDLRRSLGTRLVESGLPLPMVQAMMRHASITTTTAHYVHFTPERLAVHLEGSTLGDTSHNHSPRQNRVNPSTHKL